MFEPRWLKLRYREEQEIMSLFFMEHGDVFDTLTLMFAESDTPINKYYESNIRKKIEKVLDKEVVGFFKRYYRVEKLEPGRDRELVLLRLRLDDKTLLLTLMIDPTMKKSFKKLVGSEEEVFYNISLLGKNDEVLLDYTFMVETPLINY